MYAYVRVFGFAASGCGLRACGHSRLGDTVEQFLLRNGCHAENIRRADARSRFPGSSLLPFSVLGSLIETQQKSVLV